MNLRDLSARAAKRASAFATRVNFSEAVVEVITTARRRTEETWRYDAGHNAFVSLGVATKYVSAINVSNDVFFEQKNAAGELSLKVLGKERFDDLHRRTLTGQTRIIGGMWLIVAGFTPHNATSHGAIVLDLMSERVWSVLCDDDPVATLANASFQGTADQVSVDRGLANAFAVAGFTVRYDQAGRLSCGAMCH